MLTSPVRARPVARAVLAAAACAAPLAAGAQAAPADLAPPNAAAADAWQPWLGCWAADGSEQAPTGDAASANRRVCVFPTARPAAVEVRRYDGATEAGRDTIDASGARRSVARSGCQGWDQAEFSADRRRVFVHSEYACGPVRRVARGVLGITAGGAWLDVRTVSAAGAPATVHVTHFQTAAPPLAATADYAALTRARGLAVDAARRAAGTPLTSDHVAEAVRRTDATTAASWVAATGQRFALDARQLRALKGAGVPGAVTDMMIAVSNPGVFAVSGSDALGTQRSAERALRTPANRALGPMAMSPWGFNPGFGWFDPYWGSAYGYGLLNQGPLGWGLNRGFGWGYAPGGVFVGGAPVAIVRPPQPPVQLTRGSGYTGGVEGGRAARPRYDSPSSGSSWGGSGGSTSASGGGGSVGGGGGGSSSSDGGGRAAKPRP